MSPITKLELYIQQNMKLILKFLHIHANAHTQFNWNAQTSNASRLIWLIHCLKTDIDML